jgi:hypothetical protein
MEALRSVHIVEATLGGAPAAGFVRYSLNAYGLATPELGGAPTSAAGGTVRPGQRGWTHWRFR